MEKTAKKALSLFLCAVLCLSLLPVSALAENEEAAEEVLTAEELPESGAEPIAEEPAEDPAAETVTTDDAVAIASGTCGENLTWTLDDAGLLTISGTGDMTNYSLCEAPWWENYCDVILSVVIESGVTGIGDCAFQDCRNMKSISIPEGVTRIGDYALASFDLGNRSLTEIRFPDSLTSIGKQAIYGCKAITEIRIPDGVVSIGGPFTQCDALKTISIPSSTVDIGAYLVLWCPNLTEVLVDEGNTAYTSVDGVLFSKDLKKLICFPAGKAEEYTVSEGVESIGKYAFDFSGVRKVVLPGSVVSIGEYAFNNCSSLSDITLKSGITSIGDSAFYRCSSLTGITIPDTVTEISGHAFQDCSSLTEIRFTGDAPAIGAMAFYNVTATAYYPAGNETWTEEAMQDYGGTITWVEAPASTILYSGTCGENLTWVLDNEGTLTISGTGTMEDYFDGAPWYDYRTDIISVVIESGVTSIGNWAFARSGMTNISLPEGLTLIGDLAFDGCSSLKSISFPASLSSIGTCLFQDCTNLEEILADGENTTFSSLNGVLFDREKTVLLAYPAGKAGEEYIVPDGVTGIGDYAFYRCGELKNITLPDSLTTIGEDAFFFCSNLTGVSFPGSMTSIALGAFFECSSLTEIGFAGDAPTFGEECFFGVTATAYYPADNETWTEAVMQNYGGTITWEEAPASTILYSGTCGENLTWTLDDAGLLTISGTGAMEDYSSGGSPWFDYRANIITLVIESGVTRVGTYAFEGCRNLTNISLPDCLTIIASYAFDSCRSLTNVTLPDSLTIIGSYTFWDCASLTDVRIPASVTSIGSGAFSGCSGLTSINIPDGVAHINPQTFASCKSITNIEIPDRVTSIGWNAFFDCSSLTNITIPGGVTGIGAWAFKDCTSLTEIIFKGDAPSIEASSFTNVTATAYYPAGNETWTEEVMQNYGGSLTWTSNVPGLPINETNFPDQAFREYVTGFDSDGDGYFSAEELNAVTDISCNSKGIRDLTGIENFSRLRTLNCEWNYLENVDLSANTALEEVSLCANQLLSLNVSGLTALTSLNVGFYGYAFDDNGDPILDGPNVNKLTALDVSTNTALETLNCDANSLAALDVSGNNALTSLSCTDNKLEQLDLSANTGLLTLWVSGNPIETLDVSANTQLNFLACNATLISSLDLHANTALTGLECVDCERLTGLDLSANTELTSLVTFWSKIERLDVSANTKLETLNCSEGNLEQIVGLSRLTNLSMLFCNVNHLTALDLSFFADKESFMFDCGGQTALVSAGAGLLADGSCRVNIADLVGAENTAKVSGVTALTRADGETPELISYDEATGAAVFTAAPESIVYNYDVGCNGKKMDVTAPVSLAAGYTLTGTAISWDGEGNEVICLYSGMTEDEIKADIAAGAAGARYTAQCGEVVLNGDGQRFDVAFSFSAVEAGEYILAIDKPGNYVLKTVAVTVSGDTDLGELSLQQTGDIGGDGKVNTMDLIRLMKYINGVEVVMAEGAGDVNGDGRVNTMDLIRLMKLINGETA